MAYEEVKTPILLGASLISEPLELPCISNRIRLGGWRNSLHGARASR